LRAAAARDTVSAVSSRMQQSGACAAFVIVARPGILIAIAT
jgi:hypothetical protein